MAEQPKTQAELLAQFLDNNTRQITAEDVRDFVVSVACDVVGVRLASQALAQFARALHDFAAVALALLSVERGFLERLPLAAARCALGGE